jgi:drug/metabolite transporter (DMT)-like permease
LYAAGIVALIGATGATLGSISAIYGRLGVDPDPYWNNRLLASLILGMTGLFFVALMTLVGAYLASTTDPGMVRAGTIILILTVLPHLVSLITLPILTPEDWPHMIPHTLATLLTIIGLALAWRTSSPRENLR